MPSVRVYNINAINETRTTKECGVKVMTALSKRVTFSMALLPQVVLHSASQQLLWRQGETAAHPGTSIHLRAKEMISVWV